MRNKRLIAVFAILILFIAYVWSYVLLSRKGFEVSEKYGFEGFYFLEPRDSETWYRLNYGLVYFYYPLIFVDNKLGTGLVVAKPPDF